MEIEKIARGENQRKLLSALLRGETIERPLDKLPGTYRHCDMEGDEEFHPMLQRLRMELDGAHILMERDASLTGDRGPQYKIVQVKALKACVYAGWKIY
jgi:hypothetical protein